MPVLPLVGSMMDMPGLRRPFSSASHTMLAPTRHFTEPAGLRNSSFARTRAFAPAASLRTATSGVPPIVCALSS